MNKQDLMAYLRAVCAAEKGIDFCREAIDAIDRQISGLQACAPEQKNYKDYGQTADEATKKSNDRLVYVAGVISSILPIILFIYVVKQYSLLPFLGVLCGLFGAVIFWFLCFAIVGTIFSVAGLFRIRQKQKQLFREVNEEYRLAMERYEARLALNDQAREMLNGRRQALCGNKATLEEKLRKLYDMGILYAPFRNMVAVSQLLSYLEMGISEGLEGSDGAYAQYMQDVRVGRICGELSSLRSELRAGLNGFQNVIIGELRSAQQQVSDFSIAFRDEMEQMNRRIGEASRDIRQVANSCAGSLASLDSSVKAIAWNQYVSECDSIASSFRYSLP